jgi:hypothetical protein
MHADSYKLNALSGNGIGNLVGGKPWPETERMTNGL